MSFEYPTQERQHLLSLCQQAGRRVPVWTQGAGGNISWKGQYKGRRLLLIKASGQRLDQAGGSGGLAGVDLDRYAELNVAAGIEPEKNSASPSAEAESAYAKVLGEAADPGLKPARPSMETGFHAYLSAPYVVHLHSLAALLMAHEHHGDRQLHSWLARRLGKDVVFLPALRPGLLLAWKAAAYPQAGAIILENHGVILALQDPAELNTWAQTEIEFCRTWGYMRLAQLLEGDLLDKAALAFFDRPIPLRFYFPDTAVFYDRISKRLTPATRSKRHDQLYTLNDGDRDVQEIWAAQQILYAERPGLAELPPEIINAVAHLPTELIRLAKPAS